MSDEDPGQRWTESAFDGELPLGDAALEQELEDAEQLEDADNPALRDPRLIRRYARPLLEMASTGYFRSEFRGVENVPRHTNFLCVANHSGGPLLPDVFLMAARWWSLFGIEKPAYALVHDLPFRVPGVRDLLVRLGALRASRGNARRVLDLGATLLVYPGGEQEALRSFRNRNRIDFRGRTGFIEVAIETGTPILPVVNVGGHEVYITLFSSRFLARVSGLEQRLGLKTLPINLGLPWGIWPTGFLPYLPLPAKITYQIGKPIYVPRDPERARDRRYVAEVYTELTDTMQKMVNQLARERRFPVLG